MSTPSRALPHLDARSGAREALIAAAVLLVLLGAGKHLVRAVGAGEIIFTVIAGFQIYVPLWLIQRRGEAPESYALHAHGLLLGPVAALRRRLVHARRRRRSRGRPTRLARLLSLYGRGAKLRGGPLVRDLGLALGIALLVFPPFAIGHHYWQQAFGAGAFAFRVPDDLVATLLKNVFLVALPEEMFYRGFLEHRLERLWPTRVHVWLIPISRTVILASALFALGHFLGEYHPARLGPFFPAFVFSALTRRSGSITGAVVFHGASNAFSALLLAGYLHR
ncbi:MAG: CPBP family intramembrane metalloprotease [Deltaproteobacteria bacterium]|nr:CPBP family intramembrane metalloprotease [Deltaproteobacteria bacterium]